MLDVLCDGGWPRRGCMRMTKGRLVLEVVAFTAFHMQCSHKPEKHFPESCVFMLPMVLFACP
jgi:hypothetical protein